MANAEELAAQPLEKRMSGRRLVLMILVPLLVLVGGGFGLYASGLLDPLLGVEEEEVAEAEVEEAPPLNFEVPGYFMELEEMIVNLNSGRNQNFMQVTVSLELHSQVDEPAVLQVMPRIRDNFQSYLRNLSLEDLRGSAGLFVLREELLRRVNAAVAPVEVRDVLFNEMVVQ